MEILWFIPTGSHDGRYLGTDIGSRVATPDYLQQIAQAVDNLGYTGALLPTGRYCEDAWITSAAWDAANELIKYVDEDAIATAQKNFASSESEGQRRMSQLHGGSREALEISPNLWAGIGLVRGGAGTALVGDPDTVAARMLEYNELGIETFVFSGYPHLEEAYRTAELLFPRLPLENKPASSTPQVFSGFGEIAGNEKFAKQLTRAS